MSDCQIVVCDDYAAAGETLGDELLVTCEDPGGFTKSVTENLMASFLPIAGESKR